MFGRCGHDARIDPSDALTYSTIFVGDHVYIGRGATFSIAPRNRIQIGDKAVFGPNVSIMASDHNTNVSGRAMWDVHEKQPESDQEVVIEEDVWIGAGATVLRGVRVHRGAAVGTAAVVTKSVPPYAVAMGNPARVVRRRFPLHQALRHEETLYPACRRLSPEELADLAE